MVRSFDARRLVLEKLGRTIARKHNATNFVRAKLNPKIHELVTMIETQRLERAFDRLLTAFDDVRPNPVIL